jgi:bifunctional DNA-binding transcriptional regulator/antitoxin component of YhaV-PrlF toxin-antitoxin module
LLFDKSKDSGEYHYMTATSTLTRKNQTTVPKAVTEALGMKPADQFLYEIEADHVILRARTGRLADLLREPPPVAPPKPPPTQSEIDEAVGRDLANDDARIRRQWRGRQKKLRP